MKPSVCIDMMFSHLDFPARFAAVKAAGIDTVEFWKWTNKDIDGVAAALRENGMHLGVFNIDSTDPQLSFDLSRGILNAGRAEELLAALRESLPVYRKLGAVGMIVLVGETIPHLTAEEQRENVYRCLCHVKDFAEREGVTLLVEPLNATDRQNYFMPEARVLTDILRRVNSPRIKMLYDIYHQNVTGDFDMAHVKESIDLIGHFHVADAPGRHEPGTGTVDYVSILKEINTLPYDGHIGLEYRATVRDDLTLGFLAQV
ncbi:MAG: TIM barrel protein [Clostridia bacterium]|nr:TIM barrel protein [Clostridia bacterium]